MAEYAMLIHYDYCTGCKSCEISCKNEKGLDAAPYGIKVLENGPHELHSGAWEWDYIPVLSSECDFCTGRIEGGDVPPCVLHCLAQCLEVGTVDEICARFAAKPHKALIVKL